MPKKYTFTELLKKYTSIDEDFIDTFFKNFKIDNELIFDITDIQVAKYLGIDLKTLRKRLKNEFSAVENYMENVDYMKIKTGVKNKVIYKLNYQCFAYKNKYL